MPCPLYHVARATGNDINIQQSTIIPVQPELISQMIEMDGGGGT